MAQFSALSRALDRAARGKRDKKSVASVLIERERVLFELEEELQSGTYQPSPYRTFSIFEPKPRIISAAPFRDRIVHHALMTEIEPILERDAIETSFACRPGKGGLAAIRAVQALARRHPFVLRLDISRFFVSIDHQRLLARLNVLIADEDIRDLMRKFVDLGAPAGTPGMGLPVGNLTSQHFANFFLGFMDRHAVVALGFKGWIRYVDDYVVAFGSSKRWLWARLQDMSLFLGDELGLMLNPRVTRVRPVQEGIPFLGFRIWPHYVRMDGPHFRRLRRRLERLDRAIDREAISEDDAVRSAAGLIGHAIHAHPRALRHARRRAR
ncbi:MAG: reverse transcriptase domain-containing protein [Myxococcota bacterium]